MRKIVGAAAFAAAVVALPTFSLAQIQSRVESLMDSSVFNGFYHRQTRSEEQSYLRYPLSSCWRVSRLPNGVLRAWNCQPYWFVPPVSRTARDANIAPAFTTTL